MRTRVSCRAARLIIIGAGLVALVTFVRSSQDPHTYPHYRRGFRTEWDWPAGGVALVAIATALETAVVYAVFASARPGPLWRRALTGLAFLIPWGLIVLMGTIRSAPEFAWLHVLWVWLLIASLALGAVVSGTLHTYAFVRSRKKRP